MNYKLFSICLAILFIVCAKQLPPPGGPEDKTPSEVINVFPLPNSTEIPQNTQVILEFSERMNNKTVEQAIFISPRQGDGVRYKWKGKKLIIKFPDSLRIDKTYILTIGADAQDLRKNRMKESFHLAFSTGHELDKGQISGKVFSETKTEKILVGAYSINEIPYPNPIEDYAEYITQCNSEGDYQFLYITPGHYRVFAFGDKNSDQKYGHGIETIGIPTSDVTIVPDSLSVAGINFQIALKDTTLPAIRSVIDVDQYHVDIKFSEAIEDFSKNDLTKHLSIIAENAPNDTFKIISVYMNSLDGSRVHIKTGRQIPEQQYQIITADIHDLQGNPVDTSFSTYVFNGSAQPDTIMPKLISQSIQRDAKDQPLNSSVQFIFSEALICSTLEQNFNLSDSGNVTVAGAFHWENPADVSFKPAHDFQSRMKYHVSIEVDSVFDEYGNSLADSAIDFYFRTLNKDTLSALSGRISDEHPAPAGNIHLRAHQIAKEGAHYDVVLESVGVYQFNDILPGIYFIQGFRDADNNGVYSYGRLDPFVPAERFLFYTDSIKVRSRWLNEGNDLRFKKY